MKPTWMNSTDHAASTSVILWSLPQAQGHRRFIAALLLTCFVLVTASTAQAGEESYNHDSHNHAPMQSVYACPMHPDETSQDTTYICPMHPQIVSDDPDASCPICGMDLVAKQRASAEQKNLQVYLSNRVIQNMGVRTHTVKRSSLAKSIKTQGIVEADDERILYIHPHTGGWIERLYHISEGDRVERKDELLDFYSPWINQAQLDLITALEELDMVSYEPMLKGELEAKVDKLRNTLRLLNVSPMDVMRIEKSRKVLNTVQIMAPQGGLITELNVSEGSYVELYDSMFTIVDLSEIWVMVDIFEHQASWVRKGQGHFQPVEVKTGLWGDQQVEILAGVADGEEIVVSGQFLIDSESNIQSSLLRMSE